MLSVVATPIGNMDDITPRAIKALREAEVVACEDTRRTRSLMSQLNIPFPPVIMSYRQGNELGIGEKIVSYLQEGRKVVLCSDSGFPCVSDPGYRLVSRIAQAGMDICVVPGASAVLVALVASGLPTSSFTFKGYPPRKKGPATRFFEEERDAGHTLIIFESPFRVAATLAVAYEVLGNRKAAVCAELTKKFERVTRGTLGELKETFATQKVKGELTIVIASNNPKFVEQEPETEDGGEQ